MEGLNFRQTTADDYEDVVSLRSNLYDGLDYIPSRYHQYLDISTGVGGYIGKEMVSFTFASVIDDGRTILRHSARVKMEFEGQGIATKMKEYCVHNLSNTAQREIFTTVSSIVLEKILRKTSARVVFQRERKRMSSPQKVVIDVDTGVDDAQALMLALSQPDILDVLAVTCVQGNVDITNVCRNTLRVLSVCDKLKVPVYKGCEKPLTGEGPDATHYHGRDGMGDVANPEQVDMNIIKQEHATLALLRLVNRYPGEITLIALAPLTNIAVALRLDPDFGKKLKEIIIMGGNIQGKGNTSPAAEFNFRSDPEAAHVVLKESGCPILMVPWETCADNGQSWAWTEKWLKTDTRKGRFQNGIVQHSIGRLKSANRSHYRSCDLLAMAFVIDRSVATETEELYGEVEMGGSMTRGQLVCDWRKVLGRKVNIKAVTAVDIDKARALYDVML